MKRIDIQWNLKAYISSIDKEIKGIVTIFEGDEIDGMRPTRALRITKDHRTTSFRPINRAYLLPEITEEENDAILNIAECFYSGFVKDGHCYRWIERG